MKKFLFAAMLMCLILSACKTAEDSIAVIWTDRTEFISYCEAFNSAQSRYKITVSYKENPSDALMAASEEPDIVIEKIRFSKTLESTNQPITGAFILSKKFIYTFFDINSLVITISQTGS